MGASYIPIFLDWTEVTEALSDEEKGRLVDALVMYARGDDWQTRITGNERFLFPAFKKAVDRSAEISERRRQAGASGGQQRAANASNSKQTEAKPTEEEKEEEEEKENEEIKHTRISERTAAEEFEGIWKAYPRKQGKKRAFEAYLRDRKNGTPAEVIEAGVKEYAAYVAAEKTEERFIKQGDTFFAQAAWQDNWTPRKTVGANGRHLIPEEQRSSKLTF
jgi:hypothetical protein